VVHINKKDIKKMKKILNPERTMCGAPTLMRSEKFYEEFVVEGMGKYTVKIEYCPECMKINNRRTKLKECLKCGINFVPGCLVRFVCSTCNAKNKGEHEL